MKALVVMPLSEIKGGSEMMFWQLMLHGRNKGVDWVALFLTPGPLVDDTRALGIPTYVIETGRARNIKKSWQFHQILIKILRDEKVTIVLGWIQSGHIYGGPAAWRAKLPAVWYQLGTPLGKTPRDRMTTLIPASGIIAVGGEIADAQNEMWPRRPMRVVYPGVEFDRFDLAALPSPREARKKLGLWESGPLIGIVGRLQTWKGMHVFVDAFPKILEKHPDAHGVIVGGRHDLEPEYEGQIKKQISDLGLTQTFRMTGLQKNVPEWVQAMDIFVHASDHEPFGIVIVEAMALEKPVVAGAEGGPKEIITPEKDGLLATYGDADALASAILRYLDDPNWARKIGVMAGKRAQDFSVHRYVDNIIAALDEWSS